MANVIGQLKAILGLDKSQYEAGLKGAEKSSKKFSDTIKNVGKLIAGAFAVKKIVDFGKASVNAANIQAQAENTLLVALKGRTDVQQQLIKQASELQGKTLFGDEETIKAQALIAAFVKEGDQIERVIPLVQDLATAKGMDLANAADLVSKTLGSSTNALSRYGIEVTGAVGSQERLESLTRGLTEAFGGQAEAAAKVGTGPLKQLQNSWGDFKELIGAKIIPIINRMVEVLMPLVTFLQNNVDVVLALIASLATFGSSLFVILNFAKVVGIAKGAMLALNTIMAANPLGLIVTVIAAATTGFITLWKTSETFRAKIKYVAESVSAFFEKAWIRIKYGVQSLWETTKARFNAIGDAAGLIWETIKIAFTQGIKAAKDNLVKGFSEIVNNIESAGQASREAMEKELAAIKSPNYQEILNKEKAVSEAKKAGKEAGKAYAQSFNSESSNVAESPNVENNSETANNETLTPIQPLPTMITPENLEGLQAGAELLNTIPDTISSINERTQEAGVGFEGFSTSINDNAVLMDSLNPIMDSVSETLTGVVTQGKLDMAGFASAVINSIGKVIQGLLAQAIAGVIASESKKGLLGLGLASVGVGVLMGIWRSKVPKLAEGGMVPAGYPGDTYPAMLTSGEMIVPPKKMPDIMGGNGQSEELVTRLSGKYIEIVLKRWQDDKQRIT